MMRQLTKGTDRLPAELWKLILSFLLGWTGRKSSSFSRLRCVSVQWLQFVEDIFLKLPHVRRAAGLVLAEAFDHNLHMCVSPTSPLWRLLPWVYWQQHVQVVKQLTVLEQKRRELGNERLGNEARRGVVINGLSTVRDCLPNKSLSVHAAYRFLRLSYRRSPLGDRFDRHCPKSVFQVHPPGTDISAICVMNGLVVSVGGGEIKVLDILQGHCIGTFALVGALGLGGHDMITGVKLLLDASPSRRAHGHNAAVSMLLVATSDSGAVVAVFRLLLSEWRGDERRVRSLEDDVDFERLAGQSVESSEEHKCSMSMPVADAEVGVEEQHWRRDVEVRPPIIARLQRRVVDGADICHCFGEDILVALDTTDLSVPKVLRLLFCHLPSRRTAHISLPNIRTQDVWLPGTLMTVYEWPSQRGFLSVCFFVTELPVGTLDTSHKVCVARIHGSLMHEGTEETFLMVSPSTDVARLSKGRVRSHVYFTEYISMLQHPTATDWRRARSSPTSGSETSAPNLHENVSLQATRKDVDPEEKTKHGSQHEATEQKTMDHRGPQSSACAQPIVPPPRLRFIKHNVRVVDFVFDHSDRAYRLASKRAHRKGRFLPAISTAAKGGKTPHEHKNSHGGSNRMYEETMHSSNHDGARSSVDVATSTSSLNAPVAATMTNTAAHTDTHEDDGDNDAAGSDVGGEDSDDDAHGFRPSAQLDVDGEVYVNHNDPEDEDVDDPLWTQDVRATEVVDGTTTGEHETEEEYEGKEEAEKQEFSEPGKGPADTTFCDGDDTSCKLSASGKPAVWERAGASRCHPGGVHEGGVPFARVWRHVVPDSVASLDVTAEEHMSGFTRICFETDRVVAARNDGSIVVFSDPEAYTGPVTPGILEKHRKMRHGPPEIVPQNDSNGTEMKGVNHVAEAPTLHQTSSGTRHFTGHAVAWASKWAAEWMILSSILLTLMLTPAELGLMIYNRYRLRDVRLVYFCAKWTLTAAPLLVLALSSAETSVFGCVCLLAIALSATSIGWVINRLSRWRNALSKFLLDHEVRSVIGPFLWFVILLAFFRWYSAVAHYRIRVHMYNSHVSLFDEGRCARDLEFVRQLTSHHDSALQCHGGGAGGPTGSVCESVHNQYAVCWTDQMSPSDVRPGILPHSSASALSPLWVRLSVYEVFAAVASHALMLGVPGGARGYPATMRSYTILAALSIYIHLLRPEDELNAAVLCGHALALFPSLLMASRLSSLDAFYVFVPVLGLGSLALYGMYVIYVGLVQLYATYASWTGFWVPYLIPFNAPSEWKCGRVWYLPCSLGVITKSTLADVLRPWLTVATGKMSGRMFQMYHKWAKHPDRGSVARRRYLQAAGSSIAWLGLGYSLYQLSFGNADADGGVLGFVRWVWPDHIVALTWNFAKAAIHGMWVTTVLVVNPSATLD